MANPNGSINKTLKVEGGWVNDKDDSGGETWQGVARNTSPKSAIWPIIDNYKKQFPQQYAQAVLGKPLLFNKILYADLNLAKLVFSFYTSLYWNINSLSAINDQQLADNVFDCGVNCGTGTAARMLQRAYNAVQFSSPLNPDGDIGNKTVSAINLFHPAKAVYDAFNQLRENYYNALIKAKPVNKKYRASWFSRIVPYKA